MKRRAFITLVGGAAAWPLAARAQQPERMRRIIVLMGIANDAEAQARAVALRQGLQVLGWTMGRNIQIDYSFADGDVASRMRETFDKTPADWIRNLQEHDRLVASCVADRLERGVGHRKDEIRPRRDCFFRVDAHALNITVREAIIDLDITPHGPSEHLQPLAQCPRTGLRFRVIRNSHQYDNPAHPLRLLRARRARPRSRAAES